MDKEIATKQATNALLLGIARVLSESHSAYATWLLAGFSAAFTLVLANMDIATKYIETASIKSALYVFLYSIGLAVIQKWINSVIQGGFKGGEEGNKVDIALAQNNMEIDQEFVLKEIEKATWYPARFLIKWQYNKVRQGDLLVVGRQQFKLAQLVGLLLLAQISFALYSLWLIIGGIRV